MAVATLCLLCGLDALTNWHFRQHCDLPISENEQRLLLWVNSLAEGGSVFLHSVSSGNGIYRFNEFVL